MRADDVQNAAATATAIELPPLEITDDAQDVIAEMKIGGKTPQIYELLCETFGGIKSVLLTSVPDYDGEGAPADLMFEVKSTLSQPEFWQRTDTFFELLCERFGEDVCRRTTIWQR